MSELKPFILEPMNFPPDKYEICIWEMDYSGKPEFDSIQKYILEGNIYYGLHELIDTNYERVPIGTKERKYTLVARIKNDIIAFLNLDVFKLDTPNPEMFITHVCLHPNYQNKGYGTAILNELFSTPEKYVGVKPTYIFTKIHEENFACQNLFKKFGFDITPIAFDDYVSAHTSEPMLVSESGNNAFGE